ncbi:MAG TPA: CAP domain-containing protein [Candidatus Obscuribacterales bacterium]
MKKALSLLLVPALIASCVNRPAQNNVNVSTPASSQNAKPASPGAQNTGQPSSNPASSTPSSNQSALPSASGEITEDTALRQSLVDLLRQQLPDVKELPVVSTVANEHAIQLASDPKATEFRVKAVYDPVAPGALQTRLLQEGVFPSDNLVNAYLSDGSPEGVRTRFLRQVQSLIGPVDFSNFGLGVAKRGGNWYVSLVMLTQILHIENLPLSIDSSGNRSIQGQILLAGFSQPKILMTKPDGTVQAVDAKSSSDSFQADLPLDQSGLYSFEVNVQGPLGPLPATNFILAVGAKYPSAQPVDEHSESLGNLDQARQSLIDLVNRDRQAMGLSVLQPDSKLDQAAQSHSDDMVANGFIGHNSPTQGTPQQQAAAFGVSDLVSQNLAVSRSLSNSQRELMSSPGHRRTILEPNHTHVGFGIKPGPDGFLYITQVFVQRKLDIETLPTKVPRGQSFTIHGKAAQKGFVGVFDNDKIIGDYIEVEQGQVFQLPAVLNTTGKQRLRIGFAPPGGSNLFFTFYNIWDLEVSP